MPNRADIPEPPALPLAPRDYGVGHFDSFSNVLRLFFNRIISFSQALVDVTGGGRVLYFPYLLASSTTNQTINNAGNTATATFETVDDSLDIILASDTQVTANSCGIYQIAVSGQVVGAGGSLQVWLAKNGTNVPGSTREFLIGGNLTISTVYTLELDIEEYFEVKWSATSATIQFDEVPAAAGYPTGASMSLAVNFVSNAC